MTFEPFFTVGHSTRPIGEFLELLVPNEVRRVIDVRAFPRSRTNPQYNIEALPASLAPHGIGYEHMGALGGRRAKSRDVAEDTNAFWDNASFRNYADYAMGDEFRAALDRLLALGEHERVAIMCSEAVWWRCHRRIITDYLLAADRDVWHILSRDAVEPARMTPAAQPAAGGALAYPFTLS